MTVLPIETAAPATPTTGAAPQPLVIALDIALVNSGIAGTGWTDHIRSGDRRDEERLDYVLDTAASFYRHAEYVVLEGPSFGSALQRGHDEMAAARWMIRCDLRKRGIPCAIVPPDNRTLYALGHARPKDPVTGKKYESRQVKAMVRDAVAERYGIKCTGTTKYDQADAYVLLAMGLDHLGHPLADVPPTHARALAGVQWPDLGAVNV